MVHSRSSSPTQEHSHLHRPAADARPQLHSGEYFLSNRLLDSVVYHVSSWVLALFPFPLFTSLIVSPVHVEPEQLLQEIFLP